MNEKTLFELSGDEFVNEAASELARQAGLDEEQVHKTEIVGSHDDLKRILSLLTSSGLYSNTHRRTTDTRYFNAHVQENQRIGSSTEPFPDDTKVCNDGEITKSYLENRNVLVEDFPDTSSSVYSKSPFFTGAVHEGSWSQKRADRYKQIFENVLFGSEDCDPERACRCCGRKDLPNWKYDGENIDYNQKFAPNVTKSGMKSEGQGNSQKSSFRGRCVACLVAGFAYAFIQKPFYTEAPGDYRIFCLKSDFKGLFAVRDAYEYGSELSELGVSASPILSTIDADYDESGDYRKALPSNMPTSVQSDQAQLFVMLSRLNQATVSVEHETEDYGRSGSSEIVRSITGATVYQSSNSKGGNPVRGITSMSTYSFTDQSEPYFQPVEYEYDGMSRYYFPHELIESLSTIQNPAPTVDSDLYPQMVGRFSEGLLKEDLHMIESSVFELAKQVVNESATSPSINILGARKYVKMVLENMTDITENELESLSEVGSSLGQIFDTRDDVSVLISLKNANQFDQFLQGLERAGMEGMKKASVRGETVARYNAIREDDLNTALQALSDPEKFKDAKRVIVTQASFSALYENSSTTNDDNNNGDN